MKHLSLVLILVLTACTSQPKHETPVTPADPLASIQSQLGMDRASDDLGYAEKRFNPCDFGSTADCRNQYFTVVQFQLLCRDTEGTVQSVPVTNPIISNAVRWQVGAKQGGTSTDSNGYGRFRLVTDRSAKNQRLILRIGKQFVGVSVGEISRLVLPVNWCQAGV